MKNTLEQIKTWIAIYYKEAKTENQSYYLNAFVNIYKMAFGKENEAEALKELRDLVKELDL